VSDNKKYYYLKLKEGFFDREDIKILESMKNGILYSNIYMKICLLSLKNEGRLLLNGIIPYNEDMLATVTGQNVDVIRQALKILSSKALGLLEVTDGGTIYVTMIQELIGRGSSEGERKSLYRKKIEETKKITSGTSAGQSPGQNPPELEIELEIEKEIEIKKEPKDIFGEFGNVKLTKSEHQKLIDKIGPEKTALAIEKLSSYIASKGDKYKSHYATMFSWVIESINGKPSMNKSQDAVDEMDRIRGGKSK